MEAFVTKADTHVSVADKGNFDQEFRAFLTDSFVPGRRAAVAALLCALMAEAQTDQEFGQRFRDTFLTNRRDALATMLTRAVARGELPGQLRLDTVLDVVFGVIWYRMLATREPLDDLLIDELITIVTHTSHEQTTRTSIGTTMR